MRLKEPHHYNQKYDEAVLSPIEEGSEIQSKFFKNYIAPSDKVLDFGCGRGGILASLNCAVKHGVEINEHSRIVAETLLDNVYSQVEQAPDNFYEKVISNHALEHTSSPYDYLIQLKNKLKLGGKIIIVLPLDDWRSRAQKIYKTNDINQHLYTWTPQSVGNLMKLAGFKNIRIRIITKAWSPKIFFLKRYLPVFNSLQFIIAILKKRRQLLVIAEK